jgi:condensin-2 complex subunit H2
MSKRPHPSTTQVIQPLRDLARNFDIDIEPYLQEYLYYESLNDDGSIEQPHHFTSQDKSTQFAAAALKIQNSTSIYTRKVDFLHQVVYEAHEALNEFIAGNTSSAGRRKKKSEGFDGDVEDFRAYDDQMEFLLLDDVLPVDRTGRKINLQNKYSIYTGVDHPTNASNVLDGTLNESQNNNNVTLLSLGGIMSTTRNNDETFLISRESISNTSPAAMSRMLLQNLNTDTWRLIGTDVDNTGALVMPGAKKGVFVNGELMSPELKGADDGEEVAGEGEEVQIFPGGLTPNHQEEFVARQEYDDGSFGGGNGVGFELNDDPMEDEPEPEVQPHTDTKPEKPKVQDPWETCDPHQPSNDKPNPLKIGLTYRLPPGLDEEDIPSKSVTGSRTRNVKSSKAKTEEVTKNWSKSPFATDWLEETTNEADVSTNDIKPNMDWLSNLKELIYGEEFAYLVKRYAKHFDALARQKRRQERGKDGNDQAVPEAPNDDYDDYGAGFDYGGDDDYIYDNNDGVDQPENDQGRRSNVDFAAIDDVFTTAGFHDEDNDVDYNNSQLTFEELCRAHLRKFAKSAEIYAAETQLTKRVGAWQSGLAPILEEQEKRPEFDIHTVGRQILQSVEDKLSTRKRSATGEKKLDTASGNGSGCNIIGFRQLSKDKEEYEVCRLFLSTLMLCNCGNVLVHDGKDVASTDSLQIELLNAKFEEVMKEFLAPSVADENRQLDMSEEED